MFPVVVHARIERARETMIVARFIDQCDLRVTGYVIVKKAISNNVGYWLHRTLIQLERRNAGATGQRQQNTNNDRSRIHSSDSKCETLAELRVFYEIVGHHFF